MANESDNRAVALKRSEKLGYGAGEAASSLAWNMAGGFLLLYYTDVALLPVAALGTLMLVTRILDAVFDPLVGIAVDRTRSRFGKARPYLVYAGIPFGILFVATFSVPDISASGKLLYAYLTFGFLGLLYSLLYVPYSSMLPMLTRRQDEKVQLGSFRAMGSSLASIAAYGLSMPLVSWLGGADREWGFTLAAVVMAVATVSLYLITFATCRERYSVVHDSTISPWSSLSKISRNPLFRLVFLISAIIFIRIGVMVSSLAYFAKDVLGQIWVVSVALPLSSVAILFGGFLSQHVLLRFGPRLGCIIAHGLTLPIFVAMWVFEGSPTVFIALFVLSSISGGIQAAAFYAMGADVVEWQERNFGQRDEGLVAASVSFGTKIGMAIGTAITAFALAAAGYDPARATPSANDALRALVYGAPILIGLIVMLCMNFYRPGDRKSDILPVIEGLT